MQLPTRSPLLRKHYSHTALCVHAVAQHRPVTALYPFHASYMSRTTAPDGSSYRVGWICALRTEYAAACELLDEKHRTPTPRSVDDVNIFTCGRIRAFRVVIACLPKGRYGLTSAATIAQELRHCFPAIKFGFMVGRRGGAPSKCAKTWFQRSEWRTGRILHCGFGKTIQNRVFVPVGHLNAPPRFLLTVVQQLDVIHQRKGHSLNATISQMIRNNCRLKDYARPPKHHDVLDQPQ